MLKEKNIYYEKVGKLTAFWGDQDSFLELGFKHAFGVTTAPKKDKEAIKRFVKSSAFQIIFDYFTGRIPKLFQRYHSPEDKSEYLSEDTFKMVSDILIAIVLKLDKEKD